LIDLQMTSLEAKQQRNVKHESRPSNISEFAGGPNYRTVILRFAQNGRL
jgi:hypothetical protein